RRSAMMVCEDLFENPTKENITRSTKVVGSFVYLLMKEPQSYLLLSKLSSHDPYTLQHSVGASVATIILGKKIGMTNEKELLELGMAGLLHDIGKVKVKKEIINKNGPLDELEWEEMRQHSNEGYELVKGHPELSDRTKRAILEHHEDKTGTGYPRGLRASETDIFSRIVCICDIFNALTTDRTYSKARTPFDAFQLMREKLGHKIDQELFKHLVLIYGGKIDG
ncbi:MAG TPA: HD domain-containing phosphohydrolase, partial [Bdellovibrionota bacterium]|nr:HD domain-containing phosphohydrolase [Bdellovibrionota bacterium]